MSALLTALAFVLGWTFAATPRPILLAGGWLLGQLWFRVFRVRRRLMDAHLSAAGLGFAPAERRRIGARVCVNQVRNVLEMLAWRRLLWTRSPSWLRRENPAHLDRALDAGPVILATAHTGNFDLAACAEAHRLGDLAVVSKRLSNDALDRLWQTTRQRFGVVPIADGHIATEALAALRDRTPVAIVMDQHAPERRAIEVSFFGTPARTSPALATLALRTGATVVPCYALRDGLRHRLVYRPPIAPPDPSLPLRERIEMLTRDVLADLESLVREDPAQWLWLHRRWKDAEGTPRIRAK